MLYNLVVRDLKVRYKHSVLGFFWSLLNPLLLMGVFTFVFTQLLQNNARPAFHIFFLCALLPWNWCATAVSGTLSSIVGNAHLIKKVYFPREMLPVSVVISNMINYMLSLPALLFFMIFLRPDNLGSPFAAAPVNTLGLGFTPTGLGMPDDVYLPTITFIPSAGCANVCLNEHMLWLPMLIITQAVFLVGLGFFLSALNVFFRDTSVLVEVGLSAWFFLTPIIYDAKDVAGDYINIMYYLNPMASIVANYRDIFYYNDPGSPNPFFMLRTLITVSIFFVLGYFFFMRVSRRFGEEV